jgi:hypothetical protein
MYDRPSILAPMISAAITFASLGLVALMGFAYVQGDWISIKCVLLATFGAYVAQVALVQAEMEHGHGRPAAQGLIFGAAVACYAVVVILVLVALLRAVYVW